MVDEIYKELVVVVDADEEFEIVVKVFGITKVYAIYYRRYRIFIKVGIFDKIPFFFIGV